MYIRANADPISFIIPIIIPKANSFVKKYRIDKKFPLGYNKKYDKGGRIWLIFAAL